VVSQSGAADTAAQAERVGIGSVPELDEDLVLSARFDPTRSRPSCCSTGRARSTAVSRG
jgi:hypothetical protein